MIYTDESEIRRALGLILEPGAAFELRLIGARQRQGDDWSGIRYGYFDNVDDALRAIGTMRGGFEGCYFTPNPVLPVLLNRVRNRLQRGKTDDATKDHEMVCRRWLLLDVDAKRPKGISSTAAQHKLAFDKLWLIVDALCALGWPQPIVADSGNGWHAMWRVDLPAADGDLVKRVVAALAATYSDPGVDVKALEQPDGSPRIVVDTTVTNASRIWKLYGTLAAKGENSTERPHRMSRITNAPDTLDCVPLALLEALAPAPVAAPTRERAPSRARSAFAGAGAAASKTFDAVEFVESCGFTLKTAKALDDGGTLREFAECPCQRKEGKAYLTVATTGAVGLACQNASCEYSRGAAATPGDHWRAFRAEHDPGYSPDGDGDDGAADGREERAHAVTEWAFAEHRRRVVRPVAAPPVAAVTMPRPSSSAAPLPARPATPAKRTAPAPDAPADDDAGIDAAAFFAGDAAQDERIVDRTLVSWPCATKKGKPLKGFVENTIALLDAYGITIRYNLMSHRRELQIANRKRAQECSENDALAYVRSLAERHGLNKDSVTEHLVMLATEYHPVREWIMGKPHDGVDRIWALFDSIKLRPECDVETSALLFHLWLRQCAAAALLEDGTFAAQGVLIAQGKQGTNKTRWIQSLAPPGSGWIATGVSLDPKDRDSVQQLTGYWIAELGEIDSTFRKDVAMLKAFLTRPYDEYRSAYARMPERIPRKVVFYGTVNKPEYLIDETGNRRYWTLAVFELDPEHGIDMQQLWRQVADEVLAGGRYWLSREEVLRLEDHNRPFEQTDPLGGELWAVWQGVAVDGGIFRHTIAQIWAELPSGRGRAVTAQESQRMARLLEAYKNATQTHGVTTYRVQRLKTSSASSGERGGYGGAS